MQLSQSTPGKPVGLTYIGLSWEGNRNYDPSDANSGTGPWLPGDPLTQGDQVGNYYLRIAVGRLDLEHAIPKLEY